MPKCATTPTTQRRPTPPNPAPYYHKMAGFFFFFISAHKILIGLPSIIQILIFINSRQRFRRRRRLSICRFACFPMQI